jgi:spore germination protein GerM
MSTMWRWLIAGIVAAALGVWLVTLVLPGWLADPQPASGVATAVSGEATPPEARRIRASLFYVSPGGDALVAVDSEVVYAPSPAAQARRIVEAQLAAAPAGQISAIPAGAEVRALFLTSRGEAYVDISQALATNHPGGSVHEALTIYSIVNALTVNLPDVSAVQILIEGREVDTLAGHIDLRHPLSRGLRWIAQYADRQ